MHELLGVHSIVTVTVLVVVVSTVLVVFKLTTTIVLVLVFSTFLVVIAVVIVVVSIVLLAIIGEVSTIVVLGSYTSVRVWRWERYDEKGLVIVGHINLWNYSIFAAYK